MFQTTLPVYNSENYAPIKPLLDLRENDTPNVSDLNTQIKALYDELDRRDKDVFFSIAATAYTISSYLQGKQTWQRNLYNGGTWEFSPQPQHKMDPRKVRSINTTQFQVTQMIEDLISSNPDFEPVDMFKSLTYLQSAKAAKILINHYEPIFWTPQFNLMQALNLVTAGTAIEQIKYDADLKKFDIFKEIWGEAKIEIESGYGECYACGTRAGSEDFHLWEKPNDKNEFKDMQVDGQTTALSEFPQCPNCGSFETDAQPPLIADVPTITGYERFKVGDFVLQDRPVITTRYDVSRLPEDSSYFITKDYVSKGKIRRLLGDINLGSATESDVGLDYLHKMARIGAGIGGAKREFNEPRTVKNTILNTMSLSADECALIDIPPGYGERQTISGRELPANKTLADVCPDGGTVIGFNNMEYIFGIYAKHHSKEVSTMVYFAKPNAGTGRGAEDLAEMQKRRNRLDAQQVAAVDGASPGYIAVKGSMDEADLKKIGYPNSRGFVSQAVFNMAGQDINRVVKQFPPQQVAPQLFSYSQEIEKFTQMASHNVNLSGAVFDANVQTATGQNILRSTAQEIAIPFLQSKAGARMKTVQKFLSQYREIFSDVKRQFSINSKIAGNSFNSQIEIAGRDIDPQIEFVIVSNSEIPKNYYVRRADYIGFTQALGGAEGVHTLSEINPQLFNEYTKAFNIDISVNDFERIEEICHLRMNKAFDLLELFGDMLGQVMGNGNVGGPQETGNLNADSGLGDTGVGTGEELIPPEDNSQGLLPEEENLTIDFLLENLGNLRILPKEKNHQAKADWFCHYLDSDEGIKLSEIERRVLVELAIKHEEAFAINNSMVGAAQQMAQAAVEMPMGAIQTKAALIAQSAMPQEEGAGGGTKPKAQPKPKSAGKSGK